MKKSVVLCSYNGEKYIECQLESLLKQTVQPDEVLIFDDRSTDRTVEIIKNFIEKNSLKTWKVVVNEKNMGWKKNFIQAFEKVQGEIIFPCDQDDIWDKMKIEKMSGILQSDSKVQVLAANYCALYEGKEYRKISGVFAKGISMDGSYHKIEADEKGVYILRPGCVMAIRKSFFEFAMKYYFDDYPHDALLWRNAVYADGLYQYNYEAIQFRRHSGNASDAKQHTKKEKYESICYYIKVIDYLIKMARDREDEEKIQLLLRTRKFWELRKKFYNTGKLRYGFQLFALNRKYYLTTKAALGDIYLVVRNKYGKTK